MKEEKSGNKGDIEDKISVEIPWKKIVVGGALVVALVILVELLNKIFDNYLTNFLRNLNLSFSLTYLIVAIIILAVVVLGIWFYIKKRKNKENPGDSFGEGDSFENDVEELHEEEEELKKKLHEVRKKSFEFAKKSKDEKAREHHDKLKRNFEKPIKSESDIKKVLKTVDELLGKLPEKERRKFAKTKEAEDYKITLKKYGVE